MKNNVVRCLIGVIVSLFWAMMAAQAEIKIGMAGPLTGSVQWLGEQQEAGAQKAVDHLNEKGGLLGQEITLISADDACDPKQAKAAARYLVSEKVAFVVGHMCSSTTLAVRKIYEEAGIIMISPASTNPKVTDEKGPNVFRVAGRDDHQGKFAGKYLSNKHGKSTIAIIHDGQAYGLGLAEQTKRWLNEYGVKEALFAGYEPDQKEYQRIVKRLVDAKADVLYAGGYHADIALILRLAKR